jgi:DNA-binding transcriptional regulator YdaS (Cro superfamily)
MTTVTKNVIRLAKMFPTQDAFGKRIGVSQDTVSLWVRGEREVTRHFAIKISEAFGFNLPSLHERELTANEVASVNVQPAKESTSKCSRVRYPSASAGAEACPHKVGTTLAASNKSPATPYPSASAQSVADLSALVSSQSSQIAALVKTVESLTAQIAKTPAPSASPAFGAVHCTAFQDATTGEVEEYLREENYDSRIVILHTWREPGDQPRVLWHHLGWCGPVAGTPWKLPGETSDSTRVERLRKFHAETSEAPYSSASAGFKAAKASRPTGGTRPLPQTATGKKV